MRADGQAGRCKLKGDGMHDMNKNTGFTLVELAISLMVIGLLIGGVLKGAEVVENARVNKVVRQLQSFSAATTDFMNQYGSLPGDMMTSSTRLPGCTTSPCNVAGNGDGEIGGLVGGAWVGSTTAEYNTYFYHLQAAGYLAVDPMTVAGTAITNAMKMPINDGFYYSRAIAVGIAPDTTAPMQSLMLTRLMSSPAGFTTPWLDGNGPVTPAQAAQIDRKIDNGSPITGSVVAYSGGTYCTDGTIYRELYKRPACTVVYKYMKR